MKIFSDCLRRYCVFESSLAANAQYDLQKLASELDSIAPDADRTSLLEGLRAGVVAAQLAAAEADETHMARHLLATLPPRPGFIPAVGVEEGPPPRVPPRRYGVDADVQVGAFVDFFTDSDSDGESDEGVASISDAAAASPSASFAASPAASLEASPEASPGAMDSAVRTAVPTHGRRLFGRLRVGSTSKDVSGVDATAPAGPPSPSHAEVLRRRLQEVSGGIKSATQRLRARRKSDIMAAAGAAAREQWTATGAAADAGAGAPVPTRPRSKRFATTVAADASGSGVASADVAVEGETASAAVTRAAFERAFAVAAPSHIDARSFPTKVPHGESVAAPTAAEDVSELRAER